MINVRVDRKSKGNMVIVGVVVCLTRCGDVMRQVMQQSIGATMLLGYGCGVVKGLGNQLW